MVFEADCRTPEQMRLANALCRYLELAQQPTLQILSESAVPSAFEGCGVIGTDGWIDQIAAEAPTPRKVHVAVVAAVARRAGVAGAREIHAAGGIRATPDLSALKARHASRRSPARLEAI
jgi:hypothetical protein